MNNLTVFSFENQEVRFVNGNPVASDIERMLLRKKRKPISEKAFRDEESCAYSIFDLLAIIAELAENPEINREGINKVFSFIHHFEMVNCNSSEILYCAIECYTKIKAMTYMMSGRGISGAEDQEDEIKSKPVVKEKSTFVYLIGCEKNHSMKIGISLYPEKRIKTLELSTSFPLSMLFKVSGGRDLEERLHKEFAHLSIRGEWFTWSEEIINRFRSLESLL